MRIPLPCESCRGQRRARRFPGAPSVCLPQMNPHGRGQQRGCLAVTGHLHAKLVVRGRRADVADERFPRPPVGRRPQRQPSAGRSRHRADSISPDVHDQCSWAGQPRDSLRLIGGRHSLASMPSGFLRSCIISAPCRRRPCPGPQVSSGHGDSSVEDPHSRDRRGVTTAFRGRWERSRSTLRSVPNVLGVAVNEPLRRAMAQARVTDRQLADRCGVDVKTVGRWVTQPERVPHARHRWVICEETGEDEAVLWPTAAKKAIKVGPDREVVSVYPYRSA